MVSEMLNVFSVAVMRPTQFSKITLLGICYQNSLSPVENVSDSVVTKVTIEV